MPVGKGLHKRPKGRCPACGKTVTVKKGVGPYADGRGDVMDHKPMANFPGLICRGGKALWVGTCD